MNVTSNKESVYLSIYFWDKLKMPFIHDGTHTHWKERDKIAIRKLPALFNVNCKK